MLQFATGFQQKTDAWCSGGGECTGLNSVRIIIIIILIIIITIYILIIIIIIIIILLWLRKEHTVLIVIIISVIIVIAVITLMIIIDQIRMFCGLVGEPSYIAAAEPYYEVGSCHYLHYL